MGTTDTLQKAAKGDRDALETLLVHFLNPLIADVGRKMPADIRNVLSAEDVVQEACIVAFQRIEELEPRGENAFFGWLCRIAEHCLMDATKALRAAKRGGGMQAVRAETNDDGAKDMDLFDWLAGESWTASRSIARREDLDRLQKALQLLDPDHARALRMRFIENQSITAIGQSMGRSDGAIHMLLSRALLALRSRMSKSVRQ